MRSKLDNFAKCRNCGAYAKLFGYGFVAPWIKEKCKLSDAETKLFKCEPCGFSFFQRGFSELEINNLYLDYRSLEYWKLRKKWEPWLLFSDVNALEDGESVSTVLRKRFLENMFCKAGVALNDLHGVIDYGGDLGQFIPEQVKGPKIVVDPSKSQDFQHEEVEFVPKIDQYDGPKVELIMCCHVIEHLVDFQGELRNSLNYLADGGYLYIEVPTDGFAVSFFHKTNIAKIYSKFIYKLPPVYVFLDFFTGLFRVFLKRIPFFGVVKQSEHINYFSEKSLWALADNLNMEILSFSSEEGLKQGRLKIGAQAILLRLRINQI